MSLASFRAPSLFKPDPRPSFDLGRTELWEASIQRGGVPDVPLVGGRNIVFDRVFASLAGHVARVVAVLCALSSVVVLWSAVAGRSSPTDLFYALIIIFFVWVVGLLFGLCVTVFLWLVFSPISKLHAGPIAERHSISIDDAGLRIDTTDETLYAPWGSISNIDVLVSRVDGLRWLLINIQGRRAIEVPLISSDAEQAAMSLAIVPRPSPKRADVIAIGELKRAADLGQWAREIRHAVETGYRDAGWDVSTLFSVLRDRAVVIEDRAIAACVLASLPAAREELQREVKASLPPLVLAMIRLAPDGATLVSDAWVEQISSFLQPLERAQLRAAISDSR